MLQNPSIKSSADYFLSAYMGPAAGRMTELLVLRTHTTPDFQMQHSATTVIR